MGSCVETMTTQKGSVLNARMREYTLWACGKLSVNFETLQEPPVLVTFTMKLSKKSEFNKMIARLIELN